MWPVLLRELRAQSRHGTTYGSRALAALALMAAALWFSTKNGMGIQSGAEMFLLQHQTLLATIWLLVPLLTVDCLSRERREGTIGLLFLTPLKAWQIVLAKCFVHGWRACGLWLAVLPVLAIPLLLGGVSFGMILTACALHFASIFLATAAGLLASALGKSWQASLVVVVILASLFLYGGLCLAGSIYWFIGVGGGVSSDLDSFPAVKFGFEFVVELGDGFFLAKPAGLTSFNHPFWLATALWVGSLIVLLLAVLLSSWIVRRSWQEKAPSRLQLWWRETFCTPVFLVGFFRGWMRRKLERNPVGWLEQRTWVGRTITWSWLAVMVSVMSFLLVTGGMGRDFIALFEGLAWLLMGCLAFSAAGSFRRERETGALELLLVTPLGPRAILDGRIRGLRGQFLISIGLWAAVYLYLATAFPFMESVHWLAALFRFGVMLATLPVIGLYYSLCRKNFLTAFLITLGVGLALPDVLGRIFAHVLAERVFGVDLWEFLFKDRDARDIVGSLLTPAVQLLIAWFLKRRLRRRLELRNFSFQQ